MAITAETLIELIQSAIDARAIAESRIDAKREELAELERELDLLEQEEQGYRLALTRRFPETPSEDVPGSMPAVNEGLFPLVDDIASQGRSDAVWTAVKMLSRTGSTASPAGIEDFLRERGRDDSRDAIGAALAYLNRTKRVVRVGRGQWRPLEAT
ncbi:hypothetical protein [uncultured Microbacterium sp.]|uniref:hypothetical protein n=1 Tax=uncultured Microbacterium sp. TaxID=191216 RepID=UPI002623FADB|nr:hypothetical protein [uncultured Microbacterium sp.]